MLDLVQKVLEGDGIVFERLDGSLSQQQRQRTLSRFAEDMIIYTYNGFVKQVAPHTCDCTRGSGI